MTPEQLNAALAALGWRQKDLASAADVGEVTVRKFLAGDPSIKQSTRDAMRAAAEQQGAIFITIPEIGCDGVVWKC